MATCEAIYDGPSAAKGGRCLLDADHACDHETHGIVVITFTATEYKVVQDGSQRWHWANPEGQARAYLELARR